MAELMDVPALSGNSFLDSLPGPTRIRMASLLTLTHLEKHRVLGAPGRPIESVFFPIHSLVSTLTHTLGGEAVEVGLSGHEGFSPLPLAFGSRFSRHETVVQVPDSAQSMSAVAFFAEVERDAHLGRHVKRYSEYSFSAATQFAACNAVHTLEQRYARWLLMADDRIGESEFKLTQECCAQILGVRRATVTTVAEGMSQAGLIVYHRGVMSVRNRPGLENVACECYEAVNDELLRLMGYTVRQVVS